MLLALSLARSFQKTLATVVGARPQRQMGRHSFNDISVQQLKVSVVGCYFLA